MMTSNAMTNRLRAISIIVLLAGLSSCGRSEPEPAELRESSAQASHGEWPVQ